MKTKLRHQTGMSLLELLAATFIFAVAAGGLFKVIGENSRHTQQLELRYFAQLAANNALVELHLKPSWPALGKHRQDIELGGRELELTRLVETTDNLFVRRITLQVGLEDQAPLAQLQAFMGEHP